RGKPTHLQLERRREAPFSGKPVTPSLSSPLHFAFWCRQIWGEIVYWIAQIYFVCSSGTWLVDIS
ncbi:hypothetical protein, partial [Salmonella enterica]|uniref:hypothetical protein n=1 Tax=Salmonella enterica TaxID=28901 RepID=UPI001CB6BF87